MIAADQPLVRRAARVVVVEPAGRLLLLAVRDTVDGQIGWFMPGGGVETGETVEQAARRELAEELELADAPGLVGPLWSSHYRFDWNGRRVEQEEWFFVLRLEDPLALPAASHHDAVGSGFEGSRWVTTSELARLDSVIGPTDLVQRLTTLLGDSD